MFLLYNADFCSQTCDVSGRSYSTLASFLGDFQVTSTATCPAQTIPAGTTVQGFCRGSASVPRGFVSVEVGASNARSQCESEAAVVDSDKNGPTVGDQCNDQLHVWVEQITVIHIIGKINYKYYTYSLQSSEV